MVASTLGTRLELELEPPWAFVPRDQSLCCRDALAFSYAHTTPYMGLQVH